MRRLALAALALCAARSTRGDAPAEKVQLVRVEGGLVGPRAQFRVRYQLAIAASHPGYQTTIELPSNAVAIGAVVTEGGNRQSIELVEAGVARRRFDALMTRAHAPRRRAALLLESRRGDQIDVSAALGVEGRVGLELEVEAPTCFHRDLRHVLVPDEWIRRRGVALQLSPVPRDELTEACSHDVTDHTWLAFPSPPPSRLLAFGGRLAAGGAHYARVELDLASELGVVPRDLVTAIVFDNSRSMTSAQLAGQRSLVAAYLRAAPESRVQVIAFARHPRSLLSGWATARDTGAGVAATLAALNPQNGSNVDAALDEAGRWLAQTSGTRRVLLVGDEQLPARLRGMDPASLGRGLPAGTLVHVAAIHTYAGAPERSDHVVLAPLAAATGGMAVTSGADDPALDATLLVRPVSLDNVVVKGVGWKPIEDCSGDLAEGRACVWWAEGTPDAEPPVVEGMLWSKRITQVVRPDPAFAAQLARELAVEEHRRFTADQQAELELAARAVNPRWSLYGTWGGRGGYADRDIEHLYVSGSHSSSMPSHLIGGGTRMPRRTTTIDLAPQLRSAVASCRVDRAVTATVETTLSEIVAVTVTLGGSPRAAGDQARAIACIEDAIWATALEVPMHFPRGVSTVRFDALPRSVPAPRPLAVPSAPNTTPRTAPDTAPDTASDTASKRLPHTSPSRATTLTPRR